MPADSTANPWFWHVISTFPVALFSTGWFAPRWPNLSLKVCGAAGQAQKLMPQANAEDRLLAQEFTDRVLGIVDRLRIARPVGEKDAVGSRARISSAVAVPGRTVTRQPMSNRCRAMFYFMP